MEQNRQGGGHVKRIGKRCLALGLALILLPLGGLALEQRREEEKAISEAAFEAINERRVKARLAPFEAFEPLQEAANLRARELAESFSIKRPDGSKASTAYDQPWEKFSEYILKDVDDGQKVGKRLASGESRKKVVLGKQHTHAAVGVYIPDDVGADDDWDIYYCLLVVRQTEFWEDEAVESE